MRQVWQRSKQWKIVKSRCKDGEGYDVCEECNKRVPKIFVDHTIPIGDMLDHGFIERLMVSSEGLRGLCNECHKPKTKKDNMETKAKKKKLKIVEEKEEVFTPVQIDDDINEMDLWTKDKIKLQIERNNQKAKEQASPLDMFL